MKKDTILPILVVVAILLVWGYVDRTFIKPRFPDPVKSAAPATPAVPAAVPGAPAAVPSLQAPSAPGTPAPATPAAPVVEQAPEQTTVLSNALVRVVLSNRGASVTEAMFPGYKLTQAPDSPQVVFDFRSRPALALAGLPGLGSDSSFQVVSSTATSVTYRAVSPQGLKLERRLELDPANFLLRGVDIFVNQSGQDLAVPAHDWQLGALRRLDAADETYPTTGVDANHTGGVGVKHYARDIWKLLDKSASTNATFVINGAHSWLTVKNRFFCQLLSVSEGEMAFPESATVQAESDRPDGKTLLTRAVAAAARMPAFQMLPDVAYKRDFSLFLGPTKATKLRALGAGQEGTVDYQLWRIFSFVEHICGWLASALNGIHAVVPNYGLAIILLTFLVRMALWPLTHKSSVSMRKMQALQPQMAAIKEKYSAPEQRAKQQQAMMTLFKENKVNPAAGCLPILVQIPVFIGLYGTLRTAIELRFAHFLWVKDLSLSEGLLHGMVPLIGELNILPLLMGITMYFQQKMTPSTMDPAQQKIMNFMPVMLVVMCYKMPAGLLLYWTTSNIISIAQLVINVKWLNMHPIVPAGVPAKPTGAGNRPVPGNKPGKR